MVVGKTLYQAAQPGTEFLVMAQQQPELQKSMGCRNGRCCIGYKIAVVKNLAGDLYG